MTANTEVMDPKVEEELELSGHDTKRGGMDPALLGMMLFIASEVMFFAALFAAYFNARATLPVFPPEGTEFIDPFGIPLIATAILILSSITMQWGTGRIRAGDRTGLNRAVTITLILGVIFLIMQAYDYYILITHDDFGIDSGVYGTLFYTLTGFHGVHVSLGSLMLMSLVVASVQGRLKPQNAETVEIVGLYWHFVDIVWIFIFTVIYLIPAE